MRLINVILVNVVCEIDKCDIGECALDKCDIGECGM